MLPCLSMSFQQPEARAAGLAAAKTDCLQPMCSHHASARVLLDVDETMPRPADRIGGRCCRRLGGDAVVDSAAASVIPCSLQEHAGSRCARSSPGYGCSVWVHSRRQSLRTCDICRSRIHARLPVIMRLAEAFARVARCGRSTTCAELFVCGRSTYWRARRGREAEVVNGRDSSQRGAGRRGKAGQSTGSELVSCSRGTATI